MLLHLIALGILGASSGSGGGPITDTGPVIASAARTIILSPVQAVNSVAAGIPLGAGVWLQNYDPADHAPYAFDFSQLLDDAEKIGQIDEIVMSASAALLGVSVDDTVGASPIIDVTNGDKVQLWFVVDPASWDAVWFELGGALIPVTVRVATNTSPPKRYERTGVLTVRQQ